ncbi:MAG TPA: hypothetical protein V6D20_18330 [Candidatus Obscuribacterales bacterium]
MGDIIDEYNNRVPTPGNGRAKRARIDREGNLVATNVYYYTDSDSQTVASRASLRQLLTDSEDVTAPGPVSLTVPITTFSANVTVPDGTFVGQRKVLVALFATATATFTTTVGAWTVLTFPAVGESVSVVWLGAGVGWAVIGTSAGTGAVLVGPTYS